MSPAPDPALPAFSRLRVWERDGQRAPNKPLLVLLTLGRWVQGDRGPYKYADIEEPLRDLLVEFGPPRRSYHPEFPFWYLKNDGVWEVVPDEDCRVGVRLGHAPVGVEAAHIRWHASGGPDEVTNGLCLCSLHHELFDRGALTLSPDGQQVWVSERANGKNVERALGRFHGRKVALPNRGEDAPAPEHVAWHHKEVFQGRPRG
jgi:predicted restriction endonuclease